MRICPIMPDTIKYLDIPDFSSPRSIALRNVIATVKTELGKHAEVPALSSCGENLVKYVRVER